MGPSFKGANLTFVHTYTEWSPTDIFGLAMNIKKLNRKAELDTFLIMFGCGISDIHLFREALYRHTKHVQLVVFEKQDMVSIGPVYTTDLYTIVPSIDLTHECR